ncbi:hypothetical protein [Saccharomonospora iraqiensis]|uniref:hypothetical protein n=1 Tax=Saccharomonospora iraqiensis TaxID=52698 RepID=UPI00022E67ED|nr:hypothetical protein [Saccharomonospora iraqiensis]
MTGTSAPPVVDGVDVDRVAEVVRSCPGVADLVGGDVLPAIGPVTTYLPGRRLGGVRVEPDRVTVQVTGDWTVALPALARQVRSALAPLVGDRRVDVVVADLVDLPDTAGSGDPNRT